jgi:hypothetical protein
MAIISAAGLDGYSGHIGAEYEFNLKDPKATNYVETVIQAGRDAGLVCVDIVGSRFKAKRDRYGTFTSDRSEDRQLALDNMCWAGDLATKMGVKKIRVWFGSDGKMGPEHKNTLETIPRIEEGLLKFHEKYPGMIVQVEGKPGEPEIFQVIGGTGNGIALCLSLNHQTGVEYENGRFIDAWARIGPEGNHMVMNGEDMEEGVGQAMCYGVMGDFHDGDGVFRLARDCDQQTGKWNPAMNVERLGRLQEGYKQGLYDSDCIILDQNASLAPRGRQQIGQLTLSRNFIRAALDVTADPKYNDTVKQLRTERRFSDLDAFVMGEVGTVMKKAGEEYKREHGQKWIV